MAVDMKGIVMKLPAPKTRAIADWVLEVSALVFVFPVLDYFMHGRQAPVWIPLVGLLSALCGFTIGVYLTPNKEKQE